MRASFALGLVGMLLGCTAPDRVLPADPEVFAVDPTPILRIGVSEGEPPYEFHHAISARRLPDGRIVVADGGSGRLRWYGPDGTYLLAAGSRGDGPGEFRGTPTLFPWPGDSIATYDPSLERLTLFTTSGTVGRVVASGPELREANPWTPWLHRRAAVLGTGDTEARGCVVSALDAMPIPAVEAGLRLLLRDDAGRLWVRMGGPDSAAWSVWSASGVPQGVATFPASFDLLQAGADFALGRESADDATERIVVYRLTDPRPAGPCLPAVAEPLPIPRPEAVTVSLRNLITGQEMAYAMGGSYTARADSVPVVPPEGQFFWFYRADRTGWLGAVLETTSEVACVISIGNLVPGGWLDGRLVCG